MRTFQRCIQNPVKHGAFRKNIEQEKKKEHLAEIINKIHLLTIFAKHSILDV